MYQKFTLHNAQQGFLKLKHQVAVLAEIATLTNCCPDNIPTEIRILFKVDMITIDQKSLMQQEYWVVAMKDARKAGTW